MNQGLIIGLSIAVSITIIVVVKLWLHNILKFKMDESAILNFLKNVDDNQPLSSEAISAGTNIDGTRVSQVCTKSKLIKNTADDKESWCTV